MYLNMYDCYVVFRFRLKIPNPTHRPGSAYLNFFGLDIMPPKPLFKRALKILLGAETTQ